MGDALLPYDERYSVSDWETWNDPRELIEGKPYAMSPAPGLLLQAISSEIIQHLGPQLKACETCRILMPVDWQIDEETVVQPDLLIVCGPISGQRLKAVPPCVFEILSPSTRKKDQTVKRELYRAQGVRYYVLVDPETRNQEVFVLNDQQQYDCLENSTSWSMSVGSCLQHIDMAQIWKELD
jgi:Uma2 family endonuclease